jgi:hypothetical protein
MPMQSAEFCTLIFVCPANKKCQCLKIQTQIFWWTVSSFSLGSKNNNALLMNICRLEE